MTRTASAPRRPLQELLTASPAASLGPGLAAGFAALARVRRARPLHPRGVVTAARLRIDAPATTGMPLLDTPAEHACLVRLSRGIGRPTGRLDFTGLAMRIDDAGEDGDADILLGSTGLAPWSRIWLTMRRRVDDGPLTTLWPYVTPTGRVMIAAYPLTPIDESAPTGARFAIGVADVTEPWTRIGTLELGDVLAEAPRFDTVRHAPVGARQPAWVEALRAPAYAGARRGW